MIIQHSTCWEIHVLQSAACPSKSLRTIEFNYILIIFLSFQRTLIRYLFAEPPTSSYKEAYGYFLKAEELRGKFYIPNLYMLGKIKAKLRTFCPILRSFRKSLLFDESQLQSPILFRFSCKFDSSQLF